MSDCLYEYLVLLGVVIYCGVSVDVSFVVVDYTYANVFTYAMYASIVVVLFIMLLFACIVLSLSLL